MRAIKVYCPPGVEPPLYAFIDALDGKLKAKLLWQIFRLRNLPACELKEPHFKHFSLERYGRAKPTPAWQRDSAIIALLQGGMGILAFAGITAAPSTPSATSKT